MKRALLVTVLLLAAMPAQARLHPQSAVQAPSISIDAASAPAYPLDTPVRAVRHRHHAAKSRAARGSERATRRGSQRQAHHEAERHHVERHASSHRAAPERVKAEPAKMAPQPLPPHQDAIQTAALGDLLGIPEGWADGLSMPRPTVVHKRPRRIEGTLRIGDLRFPFASGGNGYSIPFGSFRVTPGAVGHWGSRHGAIGINDNTIYDKQLGRDREGIEIHAASHMASAGCLVIDRDRWAEFKRTVLAMVEAGSAFLHVGPSGAAITSSKASPLPPMIYLAEHVDEERRVARRHHSHIRVAHSRHRHYAHHQRHRVHLARA